MNVARIEMRLSRLEAVTIPIDEPVTRLIADPARDEWATSPKGIAGEIARRQKVGELSGNVIVRLIVPHPADGRQGGVSK
jgi:hypothetical protein